MLARITKYKASFRLIGALSVLLTVGLLAIPVMAAANVQGLWSNEPALSGYRFGDFNGDGRTDVFRIQNNQWQYSPSGTGSWQDLFLNPYATPIDDLRFGDFNGDGRTDVFVVLGNQWQYSSAGMSSWIPLASDSTPLSELRFGDFDGDGNTDVFSVSGSQWRYSPSGAGNWTPLASDSIPLSELRFGDFDGDGRTDVFSSLNGQWRYSSAGASNWISIAFDAQPISHLRFGDFDGDGRTDVFSVNGNQWRYSSGGISNWIPLASDSTPIENLRIGDFDGDRRSDVFSIANGQWRYSSGGASNWIDISPVGPTPTPPITPTLVPPPPPPPPPPPQVPWALAELQLGDFNADGRTDVFRSIGGQWQYSSAGVSPWIMLAYDVAPLQELRFGALDWTYRNDFNGDGRTDVFHALNGQWRYSAGGQGNWTPLASDPMPLEYLRFGDFDGNNRTDVFSVLGNQWRYSPNGTGNWIPLATDARALHQLRFGDFDGDGRTDVFSIQGNQWQFSSAGTSNWIPLATDSAPLEDLRFGDFNGDGRTDVFTVKGQQWFYSPSGSANWIPLASDPLPIHELRFGDFDGDGRTDVFSVDSNGRWRFSSAGQSNWILLGPPEFIPPPTPTRWPTPVPVTPIPPKPTGPPVTAQPGGCENVVINGDMEQSNGWVFGKSPIPAVYTGMQKHSGQRSIRLGNPPDAATKPQQSYSSVRQPIALPPTATSARLSFWHFYGSEEQPDNQPSNKADRQEVILLAENGDTLRILQRVRMKGGGWQRSTIDLTEFIGKRFHVYFNVYNDANPARTWMYLDDVTVDVCMQTGAIPLPQPLDVGPQPAKGGTQPSAPQAPAKSPSSGGSVWVGPTPNIPSQSSPAQSAPTTGGQNAPGAQWSTPRPKAAAPVIPQQSASQPSIPQSGSPLASAPQSSAQLQSAPASVAVNSNEAVSSSAATPIGTPTNTATVTATPTPTPSNTPIPTLVAGAERNGDPRALSAPVVTPLPAIPDGAVEANVLDVIDGQTIEVVIGPSATVSRPGSGILPIQHMSGDESGVDNLIQSQEGNGPKYVTRVIRYAEIITPPIDTDPGMVSAAANRALVEGETVYIELTGSAAEVEEDSAGDVMEDDYSSASVDALEAYVFLEDGELANAVMVRGGYAVLAPSAAGSKYEARLLAAQTEAQKAQIGMWSLTPVAEETAAAAMEATRSVTATPTPTATPTATPTNTPAPTEEVRATETAEATAESGEAMAPDPTSMVLSDEDDDEDEADEQSLCKEIIVNGGFEDGKNGWRIVNSERPAIITDTVTFGASDFAARLGIIDESNIASISAISQNVDLPEDASNIVLSIRYYPLHEEDPGPGDLQYIDVYDAETGQFVGRVVGKLMNDRTWLAANYDLTPLAGKPVRIMFAVNNDGVGGTTAVYIDNVSIQACNFDTSSATSGDQNPEPTVTVSGSVEEQRDDAAEEAVENSDIAMTSVDAEQAYELASAESNASGALSSGKVFLARLFTGAIMFSILGVIAFAAIVIVKTEDGIDSHTS